MTAVRTATSSAGTLRTRLPRADRETRILDTAERLFYARGVHEVGMDELVRETGLGKATVYRLYPTKDELVAAYLDRRMQRIVTLIDDDLERLPPRRALLSVLDAVEGDVRRDEFRGCAFNNASVEHDDPTHPARAAARAYRAALLDRLSLASRTLLPGRPAAADRLARRLAVLVDGVYTSALHLGPDGPAAAGLALARDLVREAARS